MGGPLNGRRELKVGQGQCCLWSRHPLINQMNADVPSLSAGADFWRPFRENMMASLSVDGPSIVGRHQLPVVVFVDRQVGTFLSGSLWPH